MPNSKAKSFRLLYIISFLSFLFMLGLGIALPSLPLAVLSAGGTSFEASLVISVWGITYVFLNIPLGMITDIIGPKKTVPLATLGNGLIALLYFFTRTYTFFILGRFLQGILEAMVWNGLFGLIAYIYENQKLKALGFLSGAMSLGFSIGPAFNSVISTFLDFKVTFIPYFLTSFISGIGFLLLMNKIQYYKIIKTDVKSLTKLAFRRTDILFVLALIIIVCFGFLDSILQSHYSLIINFWNVSSGTGSWLLSIYYLSVLISQISLKYTHSIAESKIFTPLSLFIAFILLGSHSLLRNSLYLLVLTWSYVGVTVGINSVKIQTMLADRLKTRSSTAMGIFYTSWGIGYVLGGPLSIYMLEYLLLLDFISILFLINTIISFILTIFFVKIRR